MTTEPAIDLSGMKKRDCLAVPFFNSDVTVCVDCITADTGMLDCFLLHGPESRSSLAVEAAPGQFVFLMTTLSCI
jgi:hypothetical protein